MSGDSGIRIGPPGDRERYTVLTRIGSGGEGEVWYGTRKLIDGVQDVAIKAYHTKRLRADEPLESFAARVETQVARLRELNDPGIAGVHESFVGPPLLSGPAEGREDEIVYLVMKYVEGVPLSEWFDEGTSPIKRLRVLNDAAAALDKLHQTGQVHGDIKTSNLLVETLEVSGDRTVSRAVLVDFGLMRQIVNAPPSAVMGTPGYAAPELNDDGYSPASDLYAFAYVCAWIVCGGQPGHDVAGAMRSAGLPENIVATLIGGLDPDPTVRSEQLSNGISGWLSRLQSELSTTIPIRSATTPMPSEMRPTVPFGHQRQPASGPPPRGRHVERLHDSRSPQSSRRNPLPWMLLVGCLLVIAGLLAVRPWQSDAPDGGQIAAELDNSESTTSSSTASTSSTTAATTTSTTAPTTTTEPTTITTTTTTTTSTTAPPPDLLVERALDAGFGCRYNTGIIAFSPRWVLEDTVEVLGQTYTAPGCRIEREASAIEFNLGNAFRTATVSVGVDEGVWELYRDLESASNALYEVQFLEISGDTTRELAPPVETSLGEPVTVEVDVSDVARLHIRFEHLSGGAANVTVYDGQLHS